MKIIVQGKEIETKEITQITESPRRHHGFTIHLAGEKSVFIGEEEEYNMSNHEKGNINDRYHNLRKRVEEKWNEDKTEFVILNL